MVASNNFVTGDHTKRSAWINSFFIPATANVGSVLFCAPGAVNVLVGGSHTVTLSAPGGGGLVTILAGGGAPADFTTGLQQVYVGDPGIAYVVPFSSTAVPFPAGSVPLCFLALDAVGRIQQIIDVRPSYLSSAPNLGSGMTEAIADPTKRVYFQNNYYVPRTIALVQEIPQDLSLSAPGFTLGGGAVIISGNTISTAAKYYSTATNGVADGWGLLAINAINQGYVDPTTGAVTIRQVQTSGTFPANSLALFECTTDVVGLIRSLVDWRPSYI